MTFGPIKSYTQYFKLRLVNFDWFTWHDYEHLNWREVDLLLQAAIGWAQIRGSWRPNTDYVVGDIVFDPDDFTAAYRTATVHTSGTDFGVDQPLYWTVVADPGPPVTSVFGRFGIITGEESDYSDFFYTKAETYTQDEIDNNIEEAVETRYSKQGGELQGGMTIISPSGLHLKSPGPISVVYFENASGASLGRMFAVVTGASPDGENVGELHIAKYDGATKQAGLTFLANDVYLDRVATPLVSLSLLNRARADGRYMRWLGEWSSGTYNVNAVVRDGPYLFVANTTTSERPDDGQDPPQPSDWSILAGLTTTVIDPPPDSLQPPANFTAIAERTNDVGGMSVTFSGAASMSWGDAVTPGDGDGTPGAFQYRTDGGTWIDVSRPAVDGTTLFALTLPPYLFTVELRAVNDEGVGSQITEVGLTYPDPAADPPVLLSDIPDQMLFTLEGDDTVIDLYAFFSPATGLTFTINEGAVPGVTLVGSTLTLDGSTIRASQTVTVNAENAQGDVDSNTFAYEVQEALRLWLGSTAGDDSVGSSVLGEFTSVETNGQIPLVAVMTEGVPPLRMILSGVTANNIGTVIEVETGRLWVAAYELPVDIWEGDNLSWELEFDGTPDNWIVQAWQTALLRGDVLNADANNEAFDIAGVTLPTNGALFAGAGFAFDDIAADDGTFVSDYFDEGVMAAAHVYGSTSGPVTLSYDATLGVPGGGGGSVSPSVTLLGSESISGTNNTNVDATFDITEADRDRQLWLVTINRRDDPAWRVTTDGVTRVLTDTDIGVGGDRAHYDTAFQVTFDHYIRLWRIPTAWDVGNSLLVDYAGGDALDYPSIMLIETRDLDVGSYYVQSNIKGANSSNDVPVTLFGATPDAAAVIAVSTNMDGIDTTNGSPDDTWFDEVATGDASTLFGTGFAPEEQTDLVLNATRSGNSLARNVLAFRLSEGAPSGGGDFGAGYVVSMTDEAGPTPTDFPPLIVDGAWDLISLSDWNADGSQRARVEIDAGAIVGWDAAIFEIQVYRGSAASNPPDQYFVPISYTAGSGGVWESGGGTLPGQTEYVHLRYYRIADGVSQVAANPKSRVAAPEGGGPVDPPPGGSTGSFVTSISDNGATFNFASAAFAGRYANTGQPWVVSPVTITSITPNGFERGDGLVVNGALLNPGAALAIGASHSRGLGQPFDERITSNTSNTENYDPAQQADPALSGNIVFSGGQTGLVAKGVSLNPTGNLGSQQRQALTSMGCLDIVASTPNELALRAPVADTSRAIRYLTSDIDMTKLRNLPLRAGTSAPSFGAIRTWHEHIHNVWNRDGTKQTAYPANNMQNAGQYYAEWTAHACLALNSNALSFAEKQTIAGLICQIGEDIFGEIDRFPGNDRRGGIWQSDGQLNCGRKFPFVMSALLLNDATAKAYANGRNTQFWRPGYKPNFGGNITGTISHFNPNGTVSFSYNATALVNNPDSGRTSQPLFHEDGQTFFINQQHIDFTNLEKGGPPPQSWLKRSYWGIEAHYVPRKNVWNYNARYMHNQRLYQTAVAAVMSIMPDFYNTWNWPPVKAWVDQHRQYHTNIITTSTRQSTPAWHIGMYEDHRNSLGGAIPVWPLIQ